MVVVAKGYRVVPQRLIHGGQGFRHLHLKEHKRVFKATVERGEQLEFAKGTTLFVGNVDDQGGRLCQKSIEERLRRALSPCGAIVHVQVSVADGARDFTRDSRSAHVCFSSSKGVRSALNLGEVSSGTLDASEVTDQEGDDGRGDVAGEDRDEKGDETCGYAALIQRHRREFPDRKGLEADVDAIMRRFEQEEAAEAADRKERLKNPEGDDGFVTVTYKRKRGRNSGNPSSADATVGAEARAAKKKRKGAGELSDFYRFQTRREQLVTLRSKFEQDKARVAKMKEQRKFKPF